MDIFENEQSRSRSMGHGVYSITSAYLGLQKAFPTTLNTGPIWLQLGCEFLSWGKEEARNSKLEIFAGNCLPPEIRIVDYSCCQTLGCVWLFMTPACQASLSSAISWSFLHWENHPLNWWCYLTSSSSATLFSFCLLLCGYIPTNRFLECAWEKNYP